MEKVTLPKSLLGYFWGDKTNSLDLQKHKKYILATLLEKGDKKVIGWCIRYYGKESIKRMLPQLHLSSKSALFWRQYL